MHINKKEKKS